MESKDNLRLNPYFEDMNVSATFVSHELVANKRAAGEEVFHFGLGESPFPVPKRLQDALIEHSDKKMYLPSSGLPELCKTALNYYKDEIGLNPDDYGVLIAPGSKILLYVAQMAVEGDLIFLVPSWLSYMPQAYMLGNKVVKVPVDISGQTYDIDIDVLDKTLAEARKNGLNPRKVILNYPNNPTGLRMSEKSIKEFGEYCERESILIIADEIYGKVDFEGPYVSISKYAPNVTIVTTGLSKHFSLGGWRLGVAFVPKSFKGLHHAMVAIASETWSCVPAPLQYASIEAFKRHDDLEQHIIDCKDVHKMITTNFCKRLKEMGFTNTHAQAGFYTYVDFSPFKRALEKKSLHSSSEIAAYILGRFNVVALAGSEFGSDENELNLRMACRDYDGKKALNAYIESGRDVSNVTQFIETNAPHIHKTLEFLREFTDELKALD